MLQSCCNHVATTNSGVITQAYDGRLPLLRTQGKLWITAVVATAVLLFTPRELLANICTSIIPKL